MSPESFGPAGSVTALGAYFDSVPRSGILLEAGRDEIQRRYGYWLKSSTWFTSAWERSLIFYSC
ncbi:MAG TPA: hypothetical protein DCQ50_06760 [Chryseobacterium sp.]|nr:hypothetical protein [Chryseobacterium sp.]